MTILEMSSWGTTT